MEDVVVAHGETPRGVDEAGRVRVETTRDRVHDGELAKGVDDEEDHETSDHEADEDRGRAATGEGVAGTDEETSTDGTTDGNHVQVTSLHGTIEFDVAGTPVTPLERLEVQTVTGHERLLTEVLGDMAVTGVGPGVVGLLIGDHDGVVSVGGRHVGGHFLGHVGDVRLLRARATFWCSEGK